MAIIGIDFRKTFCDRALRLLQRVGSYRGPVVISRAQSLVLLLLLIGSVGAAGVVWLIRFRLGQVTGWDESGYMAIAIRDASALKAGGLASLVREFERQDTQAPFVPLATVPFNTLFGSGVFQSLVALQAFAAMLIAVTYFLSRTLLDRGWSLLAATCVGTMPGVTDYSRVYVFAVPAALFLTASVWALIRSNRLCHRRWVVGAGTLAGFMLLSRTMTLALWPIIAIAALGLLGAAPRGDRFRRFRSLVLAGAATLSVAGTWYLRNVLAVAAYLVQYGYGRQSASFGERYSPMSWGYWAKDVRLAADLLYLPLAAIVGLGLLIGVTYQFRSRSSLRESLSSPAFVLWVVPIVGYLALTTSKNEGTGFALPLLPALTVLAVAGVASLRSNAMRSGLAILFVGVCGGNLLMKAGDVSLLAKPLALAVPGLGSLPVLDGRGLIQAEVADDGYSIGSVTGPMPDLQKRWLPVMRQMTSFVVRYAAARQQVPYVVFGSNDPIFNTTRAELAAALWFNGAARSSGIEVPGSEDVHYYSARLGALKPNFVEVADQPPARVSTGITQRYVTSAARSLGYRPVYRFNLPDGRTASLWFRRQPTLVSASKL